MTVQPQVIIAGGGPTGLLLALLLVSENIPVVVIEQNTEIHPAFRALGYPGSTHYALRKAGIFEVVKNKGYTKSGLSWRKSAQKTSSGAMDWGEEICRWDPYENSPLKEGDVGYGMIVLPQNKLCEIMLPKLLESDLADVYMGHTITNLSQHPDSATVTTVDHTGAQRTFTAPFVVGADGGKSFIRKSLGLSLEGYTWDQVLAAVDVWLPLEYPLDGSASIYIVHPTHWCFFSAMTKPKPDQWNLWRCSLAMSKEECEAENFDEALKRKFEILFPGPRPLQYDVIRAQQYKMHQRQVQTMLKGRCMLVGDAAHLNNPWGGLGLTTGILDAASLAEALTYTIKDGRDVSVLADWAAARHAVFKNIVNPVSAANKLRCHETNPDDPFSEPFFKMIHDHGDELRDAGKASAKMVTRMSQLVDEKSQLANGTSQLVDEKSQLANGTSPLTNRMSPLTNGTSQSANDKCQLVEAQQLVDVVT